MHAQDYPAARAAFEKFITFFPPGSEKNPLYVRQNPAVARLGEARMLVGNSFLLEQKYREAADYYASLRPSLTQEMRGRAVIFELHALLTLGDNEGAMKLVDQEYPHMEGIPNWCPFKC
jgi:TolA-binding protein